MKSQVKSTPDKLTFIWDKKVCEKKYNITGYKNNKCRCVDEYLKFLEMLKPHKHELHNTKIFGIMFKLPEK
jgi:hypothetical protein